VIGHKFAELPYLTVKQAAFGAKLVNKYRKQLNPDLVKAACTIPATV
jgi:hypothetical protein